MKQGTNGVKRLFCALFSLTLCLSTFFLSALSAGCRKAGGDPAKAADEAGEGEILTHVFAPTAFPLPDGFSIRADFTPRYDPETGALTCLATKTDSREDENGVWQIERQTELITATEDEVLSREEFVIGEGENLYRGLFTKDGMIWLTTAFDEKTETERYALHVKSGDGERQCPDVQTLFDSAASGFRPWFMVDFLAADGDGCLYLAADQQIAALTPELEPLFTLDVPGHINTMAADGDGKVFAAGYFGNDGRLSLCPIEKDRRAFGEPIPLSLPNGANEILFAPGHAFYFRADEGVYAADFDESGACRTELIFDFLNSDVSRESASVLAVDGPETVLVAERGVGGAVPSLYRKTDDIDLSAVTVLRFVYTHRLEYSVGARIVAFNKAHRDVRIVAENYESNEDYYAGEQRLAEEMLTGAGGGRPDLVVVSESGPALKTIVKHGLFADLNPYTERPGILSRDNIMGCVLRTFVDGEGRLFGLTDSFSITAVVSTDELLGKYAGRNSWTAEEMLDFAESLPEGRVLIENLTRESAPAQMLGPGGYASFIAADGKSCSFDSPLFVRFLNYAASLPTYEEYRAKDPFADVAPEEKYHLYHEGKIALKQKPLRELAGFLRLELDFGTKDWRLIGQPTNGDCGTPIRTESVYAVTAPEGERADLAWEALEALLEPPEFYGGRNGFPALVSEFEKEVEEYYTFDFTFTYSGRSGWGTKDPDHERPLDEPGIRTEFTEEDERRARDILDNHCGVPYTLAADEDVTAIVEEEISAFLGGLGTAEDCAKKIQSRVSILLSEKG